jgi:regulatory protein
MSSATGGDEELSVPVAVARRLSAAQRSGEAAPGSRAELVYLVGQLSRSCGRARVEDLVGRRDYAEQELAQKLAQDGYASATVEALVERARECGLVDDARFAGAFVRSKVLAGWGRAKISRELELRGISVDEVEGWPDEFFSEADERSRALGLARRHRLTGKNDYQKLVRFLCGRGFALGMSCDVAREVLDDAR